MLITVFTPTYNRAALLPRLYESLCLQSFKDFEWLIVDDGSEDDTEQTVQIFQNENNINIRYIKQFNGGKHTAINYGAQTARGELFFIVDSDDWLPSYSLEFISDQYPSMKEKAELGGLVGKRNVVNETVSNVSLESKIIVCSLFEFRYKLGYQGDMAEVIKTSVMRKFPFPVYDGERFCTEALVWNRMSKSYKLLYFDEFIYDCEYQDGGLTSQYWQLMLNNPNGSLRYFAELLDFPLAKEKVKEALKAYNNIARVNGYSKWEILKNVGLFNFLKIYLP